MTKKSATRRALPILVAAVLLTAILVDVVAAGVKAISGKSRLAYPPSDGTGGVTVLVPSTMKAFPSELLPQ
jgi:hypothetical protein